MAPPRIGVFGGTFDPVHVGHLIAATEFRHALGLERVLFVPAARPPHKHGHPIAPDADRLAMLRLAIAGDPAFAVSTIEIDRGGVSYTVELLAILREALALAEPVFLMGADSLRDLPTWHQPRRIAALAELAAATRPGVSVDLEALAKAIPEARGRVRLVPMPLIGISSSDIRERVRTGGPIRYQVPDGVGRYIRERGLYR